MTDARCENPDVLMEGFIAYLGDPRNYVGDHFSMMEVGLGKASCYLAGYLAFAVLTIAEEWYFNPVEVWSSGYWGGIVVLDCLLIMVGLLIYGAHFLDTVVRGWTVQISYYAKDLRREFERSDVEEGEGFGKILVTRWMNELFENEDESEEERERSHVLFIRPLEREIVL